MPKFLGLFVGWTLFVFAVVNTANSAYMYATHASGSYGAGAIVRWVLFGLAFAGWDTLRKK